MQSNSYHQDFQENGYTLLSKETPQQHLLVYFTPFTYAFDVE